MENRKAHPSVTLGKFECPKDFTEVVNTEGLCLEDIDDDSELFIIQAPADVDLAKLHDQQLVLSEPTTFCYSAENGREQMYRCTTAAEDRQFSKACLVLPERSSLKLCAAEKRIEGVIYIEKRVAFPQIGFPKELYDKVKTPVILKKRAVPLSSGNSTGLSGDYKKTGASEDSAEDLPGADDLFSQHSKKKKKKKHNRHIIEDENLPGDIPVKGKKKHKQNKRDQVTLLQDEALSDAFLQVAKSEKTPLDPEHVDSQMSECDDINNKYSASLKKKKKHHGGGDTSHEVEESELSEKMVGAGSYEHSPQKRDKKKSKALNSSLSFPHFVDSQEQREKSKTKGDKSAVSSEENHNSQSSSSSPYASNYKIKEEMEDDNMEGGSSYTNQHQEINSGELPSTMEKKSKKKVNDDNQSSSASLSNNEIKEENDDDYISQEKNSSYMDSPNEELALDKKRKSKKKKKDDL